MQVKNLILGFAFLVISVPACLQADIYKTREEIVRLMTKHERLSAADHLNLMEHLKHASVFDYRPLTGDMAISVSRDVLRALKSFAKTPGNPLFQECFFEAVGVGLISDVRELVEFFGVDITAANKGGTALHRLALSSGDDRSVDMINFLVERGALLETHAPADFCEQRLTPLGLAATQAPVLGSKIVRALLAHGASLDLVSDEGHSFDQVLEWGYGQACDSVRHRFYHEDNARKSEECRHRDLEKTREIVEEIYEIPAVAKKMMPRQAEELFTCLPGEPGLTRTVLEYVHPHLQSHTRENLVQDMALVLPSEDSAQQGGMADGGPEQGAACQVGAEADLAGDFVLDLDEELQGEPAGVPYLF